MPQGNSFKSKDVVQQLIKNDVINFKLVFTLNSIGLNVEDYYLHLSEIILGLMGFDDEERTDELYEQYHELSKKALLIDISVSHQLLDKLIEEIYIALEERKMNRII